MANGWPRVGTSSPGSSVYGTPYGSFDNELGTPAGIDVIRAALSAVS